MITIKSQVLKHFEMVFLFRITFNCTNKLSCIVSRVYFYAVTESRAHAPETCVYMCHQLWASKTISALPSCLRINSIFLELYMLSSIMTQLLTVETCSTEVWETHYSVQRSRSMWCSEVTAEPSVWSSSVHLGLHQRPASLLISLEIPSKRQWILRPSWSHCDWSMPILR